jgi:F0F1-type ATP synthase delta subunit
MYSGDERRVNNSEMLALIQATIKETIIQVALEHPLTPEEITWVRLAIKAEAKRDAFRQAVIDKTLTGLIVTMLGALGVYLLQYFNAHWDWTK